MALSIWDGGPQALSICWYPSLRKGSLRHGLGIQGRNLERETDKQEGEMPAQWGTHAPPPQIASF